jgi:hypothetical protein
MIGPTSFRHQHSITLVVILAVLCMAQSLFDYSHVVRAPSYCSLEEGLLVTRVARSTRANGASAG